MVDFETPPISKDNDDDDFSAFVNFLESPTALVPPARKRDPHGEIAANGARLVGHFLHPPPKDDDDDLVKEKNAVEDKKGKKKNKKKSSDIPPATISQVLSFLPTTEDRAMLALGVLFGVGNGCVFPALAFLFANSFSDLSMAAEGLEKTRAIALQFVGIGFYGFACAAMQNFFFGVVSHRASDNFKKQWFAALLRQDASFHDVHSVSGMATALSSASSKMKRGLGRKLGEGVQFGTCFLGGLVYAFYSSWRVALVILGLLPFVSGAAFLLMQINQNKTSNDQKVREREIEGWREREKRARGPLPLLITHCREFRNFFFSLRPTPMPGRRLTGPCPPSAPSSRSTRYPK
jgi:ATP-binding cassette subfamily B (MDR/TAP) protein 1